MLGFWPRSAGLRREFLAYSVHLVTLLQGRTNRCRTIRSDTLSSRFDHALSISAAYCDFPGLWWRSGLKTGSLPVPNFLQPHGRELRRHNACSHDRVQHTKLRCVVIRFGHDLAKPLSRLSVSAGICSDLSCGQHGRCAASAPNEVSCTCLEGWFGSFCESKASITASISLPAGSSVKIGQPFIVRFNWTGLISRVNILLLHPIWTFPMYVPVRSRARSRCIDPVLSSSGTLPETWLLLGVNLVLESSLGLFLLQFPRSKASE